MKNIFMLIKTSFYLRKITAECLKYPKHSKEYELAKYYKTLIKGMEDEEMDSCTLDLAQTQVQEHLQQYSGSQPLQKLLTSMQRFLDTLHSVEKMQMN